MKNASILTMLFAHLCAAQYAFVVNAIGSSSSQSDVIAPQMLATANNLDITAYIYIGLNMPITTNSTGKVFIRPAGSAALIPANAISATAGTVTFVVPAGVPYGTAEVAWQIDTNPWQFTNVTVAQANFELARIGPAGPALAQNLNADGSLNPNGLTTPARPGQTIFLSGSGLGYGTQVSATIGGLPAAVIYAGRGSTAGYDQIQLQVPTAAADSCYEPLTLTYGQSVVTSSISVTSDGSPCRHPFQLSVSDMKTLDSGGTLATAMINMETDFQPALSTAAWRSEYAYAFVGSSPATELSGYASNFGGPGGCALQGPQAAIPFVLAGVLGNPEPSPVISAIPNLGLSLTLQHASTTLTLNGQDGTYAVTLPSPVEGSLTSPPAPIIAPGSWTWTSPGSADIAASSFDFTLPAPLQINGGAPISLRRDRDQTITWNGSAFDPAALITASLSSSTQTINCTAMARTGSLTIPQSLLSTIPGASVGSLSLNVSPPGPNMPHALFKTKSGDTLLVLIAYTTSDTRPVDFQ